MPFHARRCVAAAVAALVLATGVSADTRGHDLSGVVGASAVSGPAGAASTLGENMARGVGARAPQARPLHVVRMVPRGYEPDPAMAPERVASAVEGASAYWSEQTLGEISFRAASISGWVRTDLGCEEPTALWAEALRRVPQAAEPRAHLLVVVPSAAGAEGSGCDYGFGSLGTRDSGGSTYVTALHPELLAHELGHNLGLGHAGALDCRTGQDGRREGRAWSGCEARVYDDLFDVMGYSGEGFGGGYLGAVGIDVLGADPAAIRRVDSSVSGLRLLPVSRVGEGRRVIRIDVPGEPVYYAEYRTATGRDAAIVSSEWRPAPGLRILRADPDGGSMELDTSPGGWRYDRALHAGGTFVSASGRIEVRVVAADPEGATLDVVVHGR